MNTDIFSDFWDLVSEIWRYIPILIFLAAAGVVIFILIVVDAHRHRKKLKGRYKKRLH